LLRTTWLYSTILAALLSLLLALLAAHALLAVLAVLLSLILLAALLLPLRTVRLVFPATATGTTRTCAGPDLAVATSLPPARPAESNAVLH
jgi:hypothetical protein